MIVGVLVAAMVMIGGVVFVEMIQKAQPSVTQVSKPKADSTTWYELGYKEGFDAACNVRNKGLDSDLATELGLAKATGLFKAEVSLANSEASLYETRTGLKRSRKSFENGMTVIDYGDGKSIATMTHVGHYLELTHCSRRRGV